MSSRGVRNPTRHLNWKTTCIVRPCTPEKHICLCLPKLSDFTLLCLRDGSVKAQNNSVDNRVREKLSFGKEEISAVQLSLLIHPTWMWEEIAPFTIRTNSVFAKTKVLTTSRVSATGKMWFCVSHDLGPSHSTVSAIINTTLCCS